MKTPQQRPTEPITPPSGIAETEQPLRSEALEAELAALMAMLPPGSAVPRPAPDREAGGDEAP
jgi:hypothetical protein